MSPPTLRESVALMGLSYIVLTSVNRDDLDDGGAGHFAACVRAIRQRSPQYRGRSADTRISRGVLRDVETVVDSGLQVFAQNLETVRRLTHPVRDARAGYEQTLAVLAHAKQPSRPDVLTKSSLMLGLGETDDEVLEAMDDLRRAQVDIITLGQYLRPTANHLPVARFVTPEQFEQFREAGTCARFRECVSGPMVRSSYRAEQALAGNNVGTCGIAVIVRWLGLVDYEPTFRAMQKFVDERDAATADEIWLLEHSPVFTLGMAADRAHLLAAR